MVERGIVKIGLPPCSSVQGCPTSSSLASEIASRAAATFLSNSPRISSPAGQLRRRIRLAADRGDVERRRASGPPRASWGCPRRGWRSSRSCATSGGPATPACRRGGARGPCGCSPSPGRTRAGASRRRSWIPPCSERNGLPQSARGRAVDSGDWNQLSAGRQHAYSKNGAIPLRGRLPSVELRERGGTEARPATPGTMQLGQVRLSARRRLAEDFPRSNHRASTVRDASGRRPLRLLAASGSTNKYRPDMRSKTSGNSASRPTQTGGSFRIMATMLTMTATVKAMDVQRWACRIHSFKETSFGTSPDRVRVGYRLRLMQSSRAARRASRPSASSRSERRRGSASGPA